jgi:cytoskeletal protein RodZ
MAKTQKGFTVIEGLLILVIVGLIGFVGWYVYQAKQATDENLNTAASTNTAVKVMKKTTASVPSTNYFVIKELGVKFIDTNNPNGLSYTVDSSESTSTDTVTIRFSSTKLQSMDSNCSTGSLGNLGGHTFKTSTNAVNDSKGEAIKIGSYYFYYAHTQNPCSNSDSVDNEQTTEEAALITELQSLQAQ